MGSDFLTRNLTFPCWDISSLWNKSDSPEFSGRRWRNWFGKKEMQTTARANAASDLSSLPWSSPRLHFSAGDLRSPSENYYCPFMWGSLVTLGSTVVISHVRTACAKPEGNSVATSPSRFLSFASRTGQVTGPRRAAHLSRALNRSSKRWR